MTQFFKKYPNAIITATLILLSTLIGVGAITYLPQFPVIADSLKYEELALTLLNDQTYAYLEGIIYSPGYPVFLAFVFALFGHSYTAVYVIQFALVGVIATFVYRIAHEHFSFPRLIAFLTALVIIIWPYMILYSLLIMTEILYITFFIASIYFLMNVVRSPNLGDAILTGIFLGVATLIRPIVLLLPFWLIFFFILLYRKKILTLSQPRTYLAYALITFMLTLLPWTIHNYHRTGVLSPVNSTLPIVFDKSLTLSYENNPFGGDPAPDARAPIGEVLESKMKNVFRFWNPGAGGYQAEHVREASSMTGNLILVYKIGFFVLLFLAFLSILLPINRYLFLLWFTILYVWMLHASLFPYPRYTLPVIPLVVLLSAYTFVHQKLLRERIRALMQKTKGG